MSSSGEQQDSNRSLKNKITDCDVDTSQFENDQENILIEPTDILKNISLRTFRSKLLTCKPCKADGCDVHIRNVKQLKKPKLNSPIGWVKPVTNKFKKRTINDLLTPRQIVRHKKLKKFLFNKRVACISALRMVNHEVKQWMRPTGGPLDFLNLNPKVICQIIAEWSLGAFNHKLPSAFDNLTFPQMLKLTKHTYDHPVNQKDRYYFPEDFTYMWSEETEDANEVTKMISYLLYVVKSKGGFTNYMIESCYWRPDAMCAAQGSRGVYDTWPLEKGGCPGRICQFCGVCNIYSHRDIPNKPLRSKNPQLGVMETYDDNYTTEETTWSKDDKGRISNEHKIAWRCGFCFSDLSIKPTICEFDGILEAIDKIAMHYIGGLLDQLTKTRMTDFYDDADEHDRTTLVQHDLALAKRLLTKLYNGVVPIPTNVDPNLMKNYRNVVPQLTLLKTPLYNTNYPTFTTEMACLTGALRSIFSTKVVTINGAMVRLRDNDNTNYVNYSGWLDGSTDYTEFGKIARLNGPACLINDHTAILDAVDNHNGAYFIVPLESGHLLESITSIAVRDDKAWWMVNNKTMTLELNAITLSMLNNDVIKTDNGYYYVVEMERGNFCRMVYVTPLLNTPPNNLTFFDAMEEPELTLPLPCMADMKDGKLSIGVKCVRKRLNAELLRALCIRNIQGKMEFNALCQYAIAFNMRRYTTGKTILKQQHIDYSVIHFHVFACLYTMRLQNNMSQLLRNVFDTFNTENVLSYVTDVVNNLASQFELPEEVKTLVSFVDNTSELLARGSIPESFKYLHSYVHVRTIRGVRIFDVKRKTTFKDYNFCKHHSSKCKHTIVADGCECCGVKCATKYCKCCEPRNYDELIWGITLKSAISELLTKIAKFSQDSKNKRSNAKAVKKSATQTLGADTTQSVIPKPLSSVKPSAARSLLADFIIKVEQGKVSRASITAAANEIAETPEIYDEELTEDLIHPMVKSMLTTDRVDYYNKDGTYLVLPFFPSDYVIMRDAKIRVIERIVIPNTATNSCGYEAFQYLFQSDLTLEDFESLVGIRPFDESQIFAAAEMTRNNLMLLTENSDNVLCVRFNNESDLFATMMYQPPPKGTDIGHFLPVIAEVYEPLTYYKCEPSVPKDLRAMHVHKQNKETWMVEFTGTTSENLAMELSLSMYANAQINNVIQLPKVIRIDDKVFISNNSTTDIARDKYNFELIYCKELAEHITLDTMDVKHAMFQSHLSVPKVIPDDLTQLHRLMTIDEILKIVKSVRALLNKEPHTILYSSQTKQIVGSCLQISFETTYVKALDRVGIKNRGGSVSIGVVVSTSGNAALVQVEDLQAITDKFELMISKTSVASCLKRIYALQKASTNGQHLRQLLLNARCVMGYGGAGKSEEVLQLESQNTLAVTATTTAKDNLVLRGFPRRRCMTVERALWDKPPLISKILIDEANMLEYTDLSLFVDNDVESLNLYYDDTQISKFDNIELQGISALRLVVDYPLPANREEWNWSRRFGGTFTEQLRQLLPKIEPNPDKETSFDIENYAVMNKENLSELIVKHRPDLILNPYTEEVKRLNVWLTTLLKEWVQTGQSDNPYAGVLVRKNHSFQSKEANCVMLMQWRCNSTDMGLCRRKKYVISALTRGKEKVILVSAGFSRPILKLEDAVSSTGGSPDTLSEHLELDVEATSKLLNEVLIYEMITTKVIDKELHLFRGNMYVGKYYKDKNNVWSASSHIPMVGKRLRDALSEPPGKSVEVKIDNASNRLLSNSSRVKCLCWVNDVVVNHGRLKLGAELSNVELKKGGGCPFMSSLTIFEKGKPIVYVSDAWSGINRGLTHDSKSEMAGRLVAWLEGGNGGFWLDNITFDSRLNTYMMIDRALTLPFAALQYTSGEAKMSGNTAQANSQWLASILTKHKYASIPNWRSSVRHTIILYRSRFSSDLFGTSYVLMNSKIHQRIFTWSNSDAWVAMFNAVLGTVKPIMRKEKVIAGNFGMYLSPEEHMDKDTEVGRFLKTQKFKVELRSRERVSAKPMIAESSKGFATQCLMQEKLTNDFMTHNAKKITTDKSELIDSYTISKYGSLSKEKVISYLGMNNHLMAVMNKHYIKLMQPPNNMNQANWMATIDISREWFVAYADRMKDTLNEKIEDIKNKTNNINDTQATEILANLEDLKKKSDNSMIIERFVEPGDVVIVGSVAAGLELTDIVSMCRNKKLVVLSLPDVVNDETTTDCGIINSGPILNKVLINSAKLGFHDLGTEYLMFNDVDSIAGFTIYSVSVIQKVTIVLNMAARTGCNPLCSLHVPTINWTDIAEKKPILTTKIMQVDKRLLDRSLNYCVANNPNSNEILAYIRSLLSTYDTSRTGIFPTYNINVETAINSAIAALTLYRYNYSGVLSLTQHVMSDNIILNAILKANNVLNKDNKLSDIVVGALERGLTGINIDVRKLTEAVAEIQVQIATKPPKPIIVQDWNVSIDSKIAVVNVGPSKDTDDKSKSGTSNKGSSSSSSKASSTDSEDDDDGLGNKIEEVKPETTDVKVASNVITDWESGQILSEWGTQITLDNMELIIEDKEKEKKMIIEVDDVSFYTAKSQEGSVTGFSSKPIDVIEYGYTPNEISQDVANVHTPSNSFDKTLVEHIDLSQVLSLADINYESENDTMWMLWEQSANSQQNDFVNRCTIHNSYTKFKLIVLNYKNDYKYVPKILMQYKPHVSVQCWSDIVRMWLLMRHGGMWLDASSILDNTFGDPHDFITGPHDGLLYYQKIQNHEYTLDNWFMVTKGNLNFVKVWFKILMMIVHQGNDISAALSSIEELYPVAKGVMDVNEDYLTMHQASRVAVKVCPLPNYVLLPGFAGPLGWITGALNMPEWTRCMLENSYKPQGGALKLIGLSRKVICDWEEQTNKNFIEQFMPKVSKRDYLIIAIGTKGDILPARGLRNQLNELNLVGDLIIVGNSNHETGEIKIPMELDMLKLSDTKEIGNLNDQLSFISELFIKLTEKLSGKSYKYLYANMCMPCMNSMSRLVGAVPINFACTPTFDQIDDGSYFTMMQSNETTFNAIINNLTYKTARDNNLPWNSDGMVNGRVGIMQIMPCNKTMIKPNRTILNKFCVGNLTDGRLFNCPDEQIVLSNTSKDEKFDVLIVGPSINAKINADIQNTIDRYTNKASLLVVVSRAHKNLTKNEQSTFRKRLLTKYTRVTFLESINFIRFRGKVNTLFCHGGVGTVCDGEIVATNVVTFGKYVDQPYWNDSHHQESNVETANVIDILGKLYNIKEPPKMATVDSLLRNNGWKMQKPSIYRCKGESNIIFSPLTPDSCIELCFKHWFKTINKDWPAIGDVLLRRLMTKSQVIAFSFAVQVNLRLIEDDEAETWEWFSHGQFINIELTNIGNMLHANLTDWTTRTKLIKYTTTKEIKGLYKKVLPEIEGFNNNDTFLLQEFAKNMDLDMLIKNSSFKRKILYTLNSRQLMTRMSRVTNPIFEVGVEGRDAGVCVVNSNLPVHGKLYAMIQHGIVATAICIKSVDGGTYMISDQVVSHDSAILMDLGAKILNNVTSMLREIEEALARPLNAATLTKLRDQTINVEYENTLAKVGDKHILVYDYDNRGHDLYNEDAILANAEFITWMGEQPTEDDLKEIKETHGKRLRLCYSTGKLATRFEDNNVPNIYIVKSLAIDRNYNYVVNRGVTIKSKLMERDKAELIRMLNIEPKEKYQIHKNMIRQTKEEWIEDIGLPEHMWEIWSSRCLRERDGLFTGMCSIDGNIIPERGAFDDITTNSVAYLTANFSFALGLKCWIGRPRKGGAEYNEKEGISLGNTTDWWKKIGDGEVILKDLTVNPIMDVMIDTTETLNASKWSSSITMMNTFEEEKVYDEDIDFKLNMAGLDDDMFDNVVPTGIQNMWLNTDLSMDLRQYAPENVGVIRSKENPDAIRVTNKVILNHPTPMESRPILTKWTFEEHRSIAGRLFSKLKLRKPLKTMSCRERLTRFIQCYFEKGFLPYQEATQLIDVDAYETMVWISKRKDGLKIAQELNELLTSELGLLPLNAINIHLKLESLMKSTPIMHWGEHQARAIYWQRKAIAAISSPVFLKVKTRLKNSLKPKYVYADGLTPMQLTYKCRNCTDTKWFFENDLSKQDRQTDTPLLEVEMELYKLLGVAETVIKWWKTMHENWKFKARWNKGYAQEMRLTGQSTTALGNLITNMQVHNDFLLKNDAIVNLVLMLGDDILVMMKEKVEVGYLAKETRESHNMQSKAYYSDTCGLFCCMIAYKNAEGSVDLGPDYVRLKYRFEVTNGVSEATDDNIKARVQSYACMLGPTKEMISLRQKNNWNIPLVSWYTSTGLIPAIAERYEMDEYQVMMHYDKLCSYLNKPIAMNIEFKTYTNVRVY